MALVTWSGEPRAFSPPDGRIGETTVIKSIRAGP